VRDQSTWEEELGAGHDAPPTLDELRTGSCARSSRSCWCGIGWWLSGRALEWTIHFTVGHVVLLDPLEAFGERSSWR